MKLIVRKSISKKTNKPFAMLILDIGYRMAILSFDTSLCAEALGVSVKDLMTLDDGDYVVIEDKIE